MTISDTTDVDVRICAIPIPVTERYLGVSQENISEMVAYLNGCDLFWNVLVDEIISVYTKESKYIKYIFYRTFIKLKRFGQN